MTMETQATNIVRDSLKPAIEKLRGLSPESQAAIASIIDRLALAEGVSVAVDDKLPIENIGLWLTKLRSERKSEGTIRLYEYLARRFLRQTPSPARADVREYLTRRIDETSPSSAETERKALASLGGVLWHSPESWQAPFLAWGLMSLPSLVTALLGTQK